jgi:hypothetical protein
MISTKKFSFKTTARCLGLFAFASLAFSCGEGDTNEEVNFDDTVKVSKTAEVSNEAIHQIIISIPSPVELTSLIKESGAPFDKELLNSTSNAVKYSNNFKKSLNLGVYGADLGYINLYEKTYASIEYLDVVRTLAEDLSVGQFFDFNTIKRLATNKKNIDSIIYISTSSFENMSNYLARQKRNNVSTLMLLGGWIESMNLSCKIAIDNKNKDLMKRVGEQEVALDQMMILLGMFKDNKEYDAIYADFAQLRKLYDSITIVYVYSKPVTKAINGVLTVIDNSTSDIQITDEQFGAIAKQIALIRSKFISS